MTLFLDPKKMTKEHHAAIAALDAVEDGDDRARCAASSLVAHHNEILAAWGYKEASGHACIGRVMNRRCRRNEDDAVLPCSPPACDHQRLFYRSRDKAYLFLSQPYGLSMDHVRHMDVFAVQHGLTYRINTHPAPHFPGSVLSVMWYRVSPQ